MRANETPSQLILFAGRVCSAAQRLALSVGLITGLALCGCDDGQKVHPIPPPVRTTAPAEAPMPTIDVASLKPGEPTPAFPGFATGRVVGFDGKPIALEGCRVEIIMNGFREDTLVSVAIPTEADKNGLYVARLQKGVYVQPTGRVEFPFRGKQFRLPLTPVGEKRRQQESSDGVVQDFVWKLEGPRPGESGDKARPETWIGGAIYPKYVSFHPDLNRSVREPPVGTFIELTLKPKGELADGSTGTPRVIKRNYNPTNTALSDAMILDIPLGWYEFSGEEVFPDGKRSPLKFLQAARQWGTSVEGTFESDLAKSGLKDVTVTFTRNER